MTAFQNNNGKGRLPVGAGPRRLLVLEIGRSQSRAVLVSRQPGFPKWEKAMMLPALDGTHGVSALKEALQKNKLKADYMSLVTVDDNSLLRVVSFTGQPGSPERLAQQIRQTLGIDDSYALAFQVFGNDDGDDDGEYSVLASAMVSERADALRDAVVAVGGKPTSLVSGGVAIANLVQAVPGVIAAEGGVGFLHVGDELSDLLLFHGSDLAVARQFHFGKRLIVESLMSSMQLEREVAEQFVFSESFDLSCESAPVLEPWLHQVEISLDFFERRYGGSVEQLYLFGEGARSKTLELNLSSATGRPVQAWNPLTALPGLQVPDGLAVDPQVFVRPLSEALRIVGGGVWHAV